jgi:O-antigen/teichoic acid export membrane protein
MSHTRRLASGITWNLSAFVLVAAIAFFLAPFVVHHLGNAAYGVWVLINSMLAYMGLLDLGLRGAVTKFTAGYHAQGQHDAASRSVSAAFSFRLGIAVIVVGASVALSALAGRLFHIPPELLGATHIAILCTGVSFAITLTIGVYGGILAALHRFDLLSGLTLAQTCFMSLGVVVLLRTGHGIVAMSVWQLTTSIIFGVAQILVAFKIYPQLRIILGLPEKEELRKLWNYSALIFVINVNGQLIYYTDNLVVGAFLPIGGVTFYAIGGSLIEYVRQIVSSVGSTFMPMASRLGASNDAERLRRLLIEGTRAVLLITLPIDAALFLRGETFITLWMGPQYGPISGQIMRILVVAHMFACANHASGNLTFGLARHKPVAIWTAVEALANLGLSVLLVQRIGLVGVAWGTAIPSIMLDVLFWPRFITRIVGIRLLTYLWQSWLRSLFAVIPFAAACYFADRYWIAESLPRFMLQIFALLPIYVASVTLIFWKQVRELAHAWTGRYAVAQPSSQ